MRGGVGERVLEDAGLGRSFAIGTGRVEFFFQISCYRRGVMAGVESNENVSIHSKSE